LKRWSECNGQRTGGEGEEGVAGAGSEVAMLEVGEGFGCDVMRKRAKDGSLVDHPPTSGRGEGGPWPGLSPTAVLCWATFGGVAARLCVVKEGLSASRATLDRQGEMLMLHSGMEGLRGKRENKDTLIPWYLSVIERKFLIQ